MKHRTVCGMSRAFGCGIVVLGAVTIGLWPSDGACAAIIPTASIVPGKILQPWGSNELGAPSTNDVATFAIKDPGNPACLVISGEVLLPVGESCLTLPDLTVSLAKNTKSISLSVRGDRAPKKGTITLTNDVSATWVPFSTRRTGRTVVALVGGMVASNTAPALAAESHVVTLEKGARVRGVTLTVEPADMSPVNLDACVSSPEDAGAEAGMAPPLDLSSLPNGRVTVDGVPFVIGDKSVDVRLAMVGTDLSRRLKWAYHTVPSSPKRPVGSVAGNSYEALHVLAYSRAIPGHVPRMTVSYGQCVGWGGVKDEEVVPVPDIVAGGASPYVQSRVPVKLKDGKAGWLYHLRIPVTRGAVAWFVGDTDFEFNRSYRDLHNLPDPNEYGRIPSGLPSSVVVLSATAQRAPVGFAYVLGEPGNVFHETREPVLTISLTNRLDGAFTGRVYARSAGPGTSEEQLGLRTEWTVSEKVTLKKGEQRDISIKVMPREQKKRGWFDVEIGVEHEGQPVQVYRTTYAVLAPDTRQATTDSPFGTWEFWWPHASYANKDRQVSDAATLINRGGWRWTYGGFPGERSRGASMGPAELFAQYKIMFTIRSPSEAYQRGTGWWDAVEFEAKVAPSIRKDAQNPTSGLDRVYKVLHESRSSDTMLRRLSEYLGGAPYELPAAEKAQVDLQFSNVVQYCAAIKKADPGARICLINDYPGVGVEYMKRGFPKELFDAFGSEGAMFMREPERQPDWLCLLGIMRNWRLAKEQYGYQDKPIWTTEALYHSTAPACLSLHAQGVIQVREAMLALANGVERMCAAGCVRDCTDDYRWSNWGQGGYCFREPEMNPKPNYALYAWLTQILDQARYAGKIDHDSTSLHVLDFKKADGSHIYPVWCVRGRQNVTLLVKGGRPAVFDGYGNPVAATAAGERLSVAVSDTPLYVTGTTIAGVADRQPVEEPADGGRVIVDFDQPGDVDVVTEPSRILESNWDFPRLKGDYGVEFVQEDGVSAVKLSLRDDGDARKLLQRYVELKLAKPVVLKEAVEALTVRVKGNGGWGRVMFEVVDATGRVWTACGNQYAGSCNASDNRGDSYISFDGWRTLFIDMPGRYPTKDMLVYRPSTTEWWPENTPEWRQTQVDYEKAQAAYKEAMKGYPARKQAYDEAKQAYDAKAAEYKRAKPAYDKAQAADVAAMSAYKKSRSAYVNAKAAYDKAIQAGKPAGQPPVEPAEPQVHGLPVPVPPGEAPKEPKAPAGPGQLRNYGIADLTYPITLTKVILGAAPDVLYVNDEVPVKQRSVLIDKIGVKLDLSETDVVAAR